MGQSVGPDADPDDYADVAWFRGVSHHEMLGDLHFQMQLTVATGLYRHWEKLTPEICKKKIEELFDLLRSLDWDVRGKPFFDALDKCRMAVNV